MKDLTRCWRNPLTSRTKEDTHAQADTQVTKSSNVLFLSPGERQSFELENKSQHA